MQRRNFPRQRINAEATIKSMAGTMKCATDNISMGGLFVRTEQGMEVGEKTEITIHLPDYRNNGIVVVGIVTRIDQSGIAFKFHNVGHDSFCDLLTLLDAATA